jgi:molybdopterin/thiamine biosynthesis adenylyltransferase/rhodanese-related sulfurtransferase
MSRYRDLLAAVKASVSELPEEEVRGWIAGGRAFRLLDVREEDEWRAGHLPGAVHVPRGLLESRVEALVPDRTEEIVLYCARGNRSALAARSLAEIGYARVHSMSGGWDRWAAMGFEAVRPTPAAAERQDRYRRHLLLPEVGEAGQARLLGAKVLLVGLGGLGSPVALYLAAAGVGTLGLVDGDVVELSNLQRQVLHSTRTVGMRKVDSAEAAIAALNPGVSVRKFPERMVAANALELVRAHDVVVDGGDNFPTRYLANDAALLAGRPLVHGSVHRFEGQVATFVPGRGPCYRCLYPEVPPADFAPSCAEAGVLGVLPGTVGTLMANEVLKLVLGVGEPLVGRLMVFDALRAEFRTLRVRRDPACPACGDGARPVLADAGPACAG